MKPVACMANFNAAKVDCYERMLNLLNELGPQRVIALIESQTDCGWHTIWYWEFPVEPPTPAEPNNEA